MIDLKMFCVEDFHLRSATLGQPWSAGAYTYASNGHILVRVSRCHDVPENHLAPNAEELIEMAYGGEFVQMPPVQIPPLVETECEECGGSGHEHECPDCECDCKTCSGTGTTLERSTIAIDEALFATTYIRRILELPGLEISRYPAPEDPLSFRFLGGIGLLMPMKPGHPPIMTIDLAAQPTLWIAPPPRAWSWP
jgi:hypothetical protein